jgi:hypothetical protein
VATPSVYPEVGKGLRSQYLAGRLLYDARNAGTWQSDILTDVFHGSQAVASLKLRVSRGASVLTQINLPPLYPSLSATHAKEMY